MAFDPNDLHDLSGLIGTVYDSALEPTQWKGLLAALNERFPGFMGAVYTQEGEKFIGMYNPDGFNSFSQTVYDQYTIEGRVHGISDNQNDHRRELLNRIDPKIGDVYYSRDIFTDEEFRSSTSYKTVLQPAGIGHWVSLKFAESGPREAVFIFFENEKSKDTPDPEGLKLVFELISPHVVRATRIARALTMAREASESFQGFLDAIALPMLVIDRDARLVFSNTAGRRLLDRGALFRLGGNGQLRMAEPSATRHMLASVEGVERDTVPSGITGRGRSRADLAMYRAVSAQHGGGNRGGSRSLRCPAAVRDLCGDTRGRAGEPGALDGYVRSDPARGRGLRLADARPVSGRDRGANGPGGKDHSQPDPACLHEGGREFGARAQ